MHGYARTRLGVSIARHTSRGPAPQPSRRLPRSYRWWPRVALAAFVAIGALLAGTVGAQEAERLRVAVVQFSVNDLTRSLVEPEGFGLAMATRLQTALTQSRRFEVVERMLLDAVIGEQELAEFGLTSAGEAYRLGELLNAAIIVTGIINVYSDTLWEISARFIDVSTASTGDAETYLASGAQDFGNAAEAFVQRALVRYPLRGEIHAVDGDEIFISIGRLQGLTAHEGTGIIYRPREVGGLSAPRRIGTFSIVRLYERLTEIEVELEPGFSLEIGDVVEVLPVGETRSPIPARVTLTVTPADATIEVDGQITPASFERPPGRHTITIAAEHHQEQTLELDLNPGDTIERTITLQPHPGTLTISTHPADATITIDGTPHDERSLQLPPGSYTIGAEAPHHQPSQQTITIHPNQDHHLDLELTPIPAQVEPLDPVAAEPEPEPEPVAAAAVAPEARPQPAADWGTVILTTNLDGARVTFSGPMEREVRASSTPVEVVLPSGIYFVTATADGVRPVDDAVSVSVGEAQELAIVFASGRIRTAIGSFRSETSLGTLLLVAVEDIDDAMRLHITGPSGWNRDAVWSPTVDTDAPFVVLGHAALLEGTYRLEASPAGRPSIVVETNVPPTEALAMVPNLRADVDRQGDLAASWDPVPEAIAYLVDVRDAGRLAMAATTTPSVRFEQPDLGSSSAFTLCVTALDWDPSVTPGTVDGTPRASQACTRVTVDTGPTPRTRSTRPPSGPPAPPPIGPPPPPPP